MQASWACGLFARRVRSQMHLKPQKCRTVILTHLTAQASYFCHSSAAAHPPFAQAAVSSFCLYYFGAVITLKMLFAVWTENRATEEGDHCSVASQGMDRTSREISEVMPAPAVEMNIVPATNVAETGELEKMEKLEAGIGSEANGVFEDQRPPVFKSTFLEMLCVTSLVCGQLTNVSTLLIYLIARNLLMRNKSLFPL